MYLGWWSILSSNGKFRPGTMLELSTLGANRFRFFIRAEDIDWPNTDFLPDWVSWRGGFCGFSNR
jgi:hypothetical protein